VRDCCFVTSVNLSYYQLCGKKFIESFLRFVDPSIWLQLWCDASLEGKSLLDYETPDGSGQRVTLYDLGMQPNVHSFLASMNRHDHPNFSTDPLRRLSVGSGYQYRKDVRTFGLKGMALSEALSWEEPRFVFWVDADTIFQKELSFDFLVSLFGGASIIYFGRDYPHSETGFVGFDRYQGSVRELEEFRKEYTKCWTEGTVFDLPGWTDCDVFDYSLSLARKKGLHAKSLSTVPRGHVIPSSVLGPYLDHRKGPRKLEADR
jgi:hypothetical protein